jgi:hypothetical protein
MMPGLPVIAFDRVMGFCAIWAADWAARSTHFSSIRF